MFVRRLALSDFRNHRDAAIGIDAPSVVLTGQNGAGKTNLLEAVSLLSPGRGLRRAPLDEMARDGGAGGFSVAARIARTIGAPGDLDLGTGTEAHAPGRRRVSVNGSAAPAAALGEWLSVLWLTPAMDRLFADSPGGRRRFLDRLALALFPDHASHASRYEAAMRARNRLLADHSDDGRWFGALEDAMATHGARIDFARRSLVAALGEATAENGDGPFARPLLAIAGERAAPWSADALRDALGTSRQRDMRAGRTLIGPHRDDLEVRHAGSGQDAARCSTGEQKALLIGLILAHGALIAERRGQRPILLLDEVAAHLDPVRRAVLFERLRDAGGQVWMTGTEPALFDDLPGDVERLSVAGGTVVRS
ncbi:MAG: DNA replication/repair protein RecF [Sphingomonadales bacterium]|nr:DNA replication/repair protein RecF [Sphingomonadales bacterium]